MEWPTWIKVNNLIKNLNLSNWFHGWFNHEEVNVINITNALGAKKNYKISTETDKLLSTGFDGAQKIDTSQKDEFELTSEEKFIILNVNRVHVFCGRSEYDFEKNYRQALNHIRNKPSDDWHECAAKDLVQVKEDIDFFGAFKEIKNPERVELFEGKRKDINYLYGIIQQIKHSDKRGGIQDEFLSPYDKRFDNKAMTDDKYEEVFINFQNSLIEFFRLFELK